jgi:N-acetyl-anhydromuramyl-L-alanine amidase AmpD
MHVPMIQLFNAYDYQTDIFKEHKIQTQEVVDYFEARFRVALQAILTRSEHDQDWMFKLLNHELVFLISQFD